MTHKVTGPKNRESVVVYARVVVYGIANLFRYFSDDEGAKDEPQQFYQWRRGGSFARTGLSPLRTAQYYNSAVNLHENGHVRGLTLSHTWDPGSPLVPDSLSLALDCWL